MIGAEIPDGPDVHVVLDNSPTHKTPAIQRWLLRHPRFTFHFTPTSSSWLNLVETWFAELTKRKLRRSLRCARAEHKVAATVPGATPISTAMSDCWRSSTSRSAIATRSRYARWPIALQTSGESSGDRTGAQANEPRFPPGAATCDV
jgi:hypothetical protein